MSSRAILSPIRNQTAPEAALTQESGTRLRTPQIRSGRTKSVSSPIHFTAQGTMDDGSYRQAELFYLQKQIQSQTPMVIVLEDGERVEGCIEWYDRNSLKVRGRSKTLVYKSAIKYMHKLGEQGL
jgi:sRNA-binding regulator protein Hfq